MQVRSASVLALSAALCTFPCLTASAGSPAFDKTTLAWTLPWDADWVTAVSFVGPRRLAAGNKLGDILVWDLPDKVGGPAPTPVLHLVGHTNSVNRLVVAEQRWLISASNDHTVRTWDLDAKAQETGVITLNARARARRKARKRRRHRRWTSRSAPKKPSRS